MIIHGAGAFLRPGDDAVNGFVQLAFTDVFQPVARRQQGRFVQHIGQIRAGESGSALSQGLQVNIGVQRLVFGVYCQDGFAPLQVRRLYSNLAIKTSWPQQGRVQDIGAVRGSNHDDVGAFIKTVHLYQQLVQGLFTFIVTAPHPGAAVAPHRVDFIDEDNGGGRCAGLLEKVTYPRGAHPHEHLDEFRTGHTEERYPGFSGHCFGQQGFAGSRRSIEQHALRNLGP